jgi:hypothetical protein
MSTVFVATGASRRRWGLAMLALSVVVLAVAAQVGPATAQTTPPPALTKTVIVAGDSVGVSGSGCVAGTQVQVQLDGVTVITATTAAGGTYSALLVVPKSVTPGSHPVTVVCTGPNGTVTANVSITVSATATTGYSPGMPIVVAAFLLLLGGICFVATSHRRLRPVKVTSR